MKTSLLKRSPYGPKEICNIPSKWTQELRLQNRPTWWRLLLMLQILPWRIESWTIKASIEMLGRFMFIKHHWVGGKFVPADVCCGTLANYSTWCATIPHGAFLTPRLNHGWCTLSKDTSEFKTDRTSVILYPLEWSMLPIHFILVSRDVTLKRDVIIGGWSFLHHTIFIIVLDEAATWQLPQILMRGDLCPRAPSSFLTGLSA